MLFGRIREAVALMMLTALFFAGLVGPLGAAEEVTAKKPATIRIGMIQTLFRGTEPNVMIAQTRPIGDLLQTQTGIPGEICVVPDAAEMAKKIHSGELQMGVLHGIEYAWVKAKYPDLQPLIVAYNQTTRLKAYILVRADSKIQTVADLQGKTLSFPVRSLNHCYLFLHKSIKDAGLEPEGFFAPSTPPANIDLALDLVVEGAADVAVVDGVGFEVYKKQKPGRAPKLRAIAESCYYPTATFIYKPDVADEAMVKQFCQGMTTADTRLLGRQMLTLWRLTNFGNIPDDYRQMLDDILKVHPAPTTPAAFIAVPEKAEAAGK